ncbi:VOC family protein [Pedobacter sp.]|uniref:VOC family protein n=1 Tax=Pedobacter sp. TaxID=1411316 RepID=UPI00396C2D79
MHTIAYFEVQSSDPERDIKFYQRVLTGLFIKQEDLPIEYYRIETNGIAGGY